MKDQWIQTRQHKEYQFQSKRGIAVILLRLRPEKKQSAENLNSKAAPSQRQHAVHYFGNLLFFHQNAQKTQVYDQHGTHQKRDAQDVNGIDQRKSKLRFANRRSERCVVKPLAQTQEIHCSVQIPTSDCECTKLTLRASA